MNSTLQMHNAAPVTFNVAPKCVVASLMLLMDISIGSARIIILTLVHLLCNAIIYMNIFNRFWPTHYKWWKLHTLLEIITNTAPTCDYNYIVCSHNFDYQFCLLAGK